MRLLDEALNDRADRPIFQCENAEWPAGGRQIDRQGPEAVRLGRISQDDTRQNGKESPGSKQWITHRQGSDDGGWRRFEAVGLEGFRDH